jgi:hypothetical protein
MMAKENQKYKGNGKHDWERVSHSKGYGEVSRLRVPGGWLYRDDFSLTTVFVPMPEVVKHKV